MWKTAKKNKKGEKLKPDRPNRLGKVEQLCWDCNKAVGQCPWSLFAKPVEGWDADPDPDNDSYKIYDCPLFEEDE